MEKQGIIFKVTNSSFQPFHYSLSLKKRVFDVFLTLLALITLSPLLLIIILIIKFKSKGSVFFKQKRIGLNGKPFTIYKFRTMDPGAHILQKKYKHLNISPFPTFKIPNDPRFNSFGLFLSKTTLDELPQLINVLQGDMSIVGPRPFPEKEHKLLSNKWKKRSLVKPGLVSPIFFLARRKVSTNQWTKIDLNYVQNTSLTTDLRMVLKAIFYYVKLLSNQIQKLNN